MIEDDPWRIYGTFDTDVQPPTRFDFDEVKGGKHCARSPQEAGFGRRWGGRSNGTRAYMGKPA